MRGDRNYSGPYPNHETWALPQEVLTDPPRKPWYSLSTTAPRELPNSHRPYRSFYEALVGPHANSSSTECKLRWLTLTPSAPARAAVVAAYKYAVRVGAPVTWNPRQVDYLSYGPRTNDTLAYRNWVRRTLKTSGLAERLPAGLSELPDIYAEMPAAWAGLERLGRPRNYRQLVRHLARHLDWYLDPTQQVKPPVWVVGTLPSLLLAGLLGFLPTRFTALAGFMPGIIWSLAFAGFVLGIVATALIVERHKAFGATLSDFRGWQRIVNAAELFYYLREEYSPPADLLNQAEL